MLTFMLTAIMAFGGLQPRVASADPVQPPVTIGPVTADFYPNPGDSGVFNPGVLGSGPAFSQQVPEIDFNPPNSAQVACSTNTGVDEYTRPFTDVVQYADGSCGTIPTQAGTGSLNSFQMVASANLVVAAPGQVTFNFFSDDGWVLGIGQQVNGTAQPTFLSGQMANPPADSAAHGYPVVGSFNQPSSPAQNTVTVNFPNAGTYPLEVDYTECCGGQLSLTLGTSYGNPIPPTNAPPPPQAFTNCPSTGSTLPTHFNSVQAPAPFQSVKNYDIRYEPLDLTWTSQSPPGTVLGQTGVCQLSSNSGVLGVTVQIHISLPWPIGDQTIDVSAATSTASATLEYFKYPSASMVSTCDWSVLDHVIITSLLAMPTGSNDCVISGNTPAPGDRMVQWNTDGFVFKGPFGIEFYKTPPLTYYVDLDQIAGQLPGGPGDVSTDLNAVEWFIHTTLIQHLPAISSLALIQDPPANVLVRNPDGLVTGKTPAGNVVNQIPQAVYVDTKAGGAVLIINPKDGAYGVQVNGTPNDSYYLAMSAVSFNPDGLHPTGAVTIDQRNLNANGIATDCYPIGVVASCPTPSTDPFAFFPSSPNVSLKGNEASGNTRLQVRASSDANGVTSGTLSAGDTRTNVPLTPFSIDGGNVASLQCTGSNSGLAYGSATVNGAPLYFATWVTGHVVGTPNDPQANTYHLIASNGYDSGFITAPATRLGGC